MGMWVQPDINAARRVLRAWCERTKTYPKRKRAEAALLRLFAEGYSEKQVADATREAVAMSDASLRIALKRVRPERDLVREREEVGYSSVEPSRWVDDVPDGALSGTLPPPPVIDDEPYEPEGPLPSAAQLERQARNERLAEITLSPEERERHEAAAAAALAELENAWLEDE